MTDMEPIDKTNHKVPKSSEFPCNERKSKLTILIDLDNTFSFEEIELNEIIK